jgi:hypothetical protein
MEINSFFRTKSSDHQGIVYQVIKENKDNYTCIGSRSIGVVDGKIIWDKTILAPLGVYWESLYPKNRWGGNFKSLVDCPHFERNV